MNRFLLGVFLTGLACMATAGTESFMRECEKGATLGLITLVEQERIPVQNLVVTKNSIAAECRKLTPEEVARLLEYSKVMSPSEVGAEFARRHFKVPESELKAYRASFMSAARERGRLTNQKLERFLEKLEVDAKSKPLTESQKRELNVVERFTQMCAYGFEVGLNALKVADVPAEEERATQKAVCKDFYADAEARGNFDAKYTDEMERDTAACALGTIVVFETRNAETTHDVLATAAAQCATIVTTPSREDVEKG